MEMGYLIDTHILLWWLFDDPQLKNQDRAIIQNPENQILVSSATAWEIATKYRIGKLPEAAPIVADHHQILEQSGDRLPVLGEPTIEIGDSLREASPTNQNLEMLHRELQVGRSRES